MVEGNWFDLFCSLLGMVGQFKKLEMTHLAHEKLTLRRHSQLIFCVVEGNWFDLFCFLLGMAG